MLAIISFLKETNVKQKFLAAAQEYALHRGDDDMFCELYTNYREHMDINDSVWYALAYLYGNEVARRIDMESAPAFI